MQIFSIYVFLSTFWIEAKMVYNCIRVVFKTETVQFETSVSSQGFCYSKRNWISPLEYVFNIFDLEDNIFLFLRFVLAQLK